MAPNGNGEPSSREDNECQGHHRVPEESRVIETAQSGREGDEQSVSGQAVQRISSGREGTEKAKWWQVVESDDKHPGGR